MKRILNKFFISPFISIVILLVDQLIKNLIIKSPEIFRTFNYGKIFAFELAYNKGVAFSINVPTAIIFIISFLVLGLLIFLLIESYKKNKNLNIYLIWIIIAGVVSNLIDRIFLGQVVDYLGFLFFPVFNLADVAIVVGAIFLVIANIKKIKVDRNSQSS